MNTGNALHYHNVFNFPDGLPIYLSKHGAVRMNIHAMHLYLSEMEEIFHQLAEFNR
jgi:hypothetical protein